ncbi:MAG: hypothetical protein ACJAXT_000819, partial [Paracoccaceae bacterium]
MLGPPNLRGEPDKVAHARWGETRVIRALWSCWQQAFWQRRVSSQQRAFWQWQVFLWLRASC